MILDTLWALIPTEAGIEHIRVRAGPEGIDVALFLRHGIPGSDPDHHARYARALLATLARASPTLSAWEISPAP